MRKKKNKEDPFTFKVGMEAFLNNLDKHIRDEKYKKKHSGKRFKKATA